MRGSGAVHVALAALAGAIIVCLYVTTDVGSSDVSVLMSTPEKAQESFKSKWSGWLATVTTNVKAAEDVSHGLTYHKLAKLNQLLHKDLAEDMLKEPRLKGDKDKKPTMDTSTNAAARKLRDAVTKKPAAVTSKPFADAVARDDSAIAEDKKGVEKAEKALALEQGTAEGEAASGTASVAVHKRSGSTLKLSRSAVTKASTPSASSKPSVAAAHTANRAKTTKAAHTSVSKAAKQQVGETRAKTKKASRVSRMEQNMLAVAMQGVLEAGLVKSAKSNAEEHKETTEEEKGWSSDLSKWGLA